MKRLATQGRGFGQLIWKNKFSDCVRLTEYIEYFALRKAILAPSMGMPDDDCRKKMQLGIGGGLFETRKFAKLLDVIR
jgi:hypothetical protein